MPYVSVVISVHNGETHLEECIDSILDQTYQDFEFIVLNNGSTDRTPEILQQYATPRLRVIHQENIGIARSLNKGINLSQGNLIARLDADDLSLPHRLERQVEFMRQNPDVVLCGSRSRELIGNKSFSQKVPYIEKDEAVRKILSCLNPFMHSTTMFRKKTFLETGGYSDRFKYSQDYDLWVRMLKLGQAYILKDELSVVRLIEHSFSNQHNRAQKLEGLLIRWNAFREFGGDPVKTLIYSLKSLIGLISPLSSIRQRNLFGDREESWDNRAKAK